MNGLRLCFQLAQEGVEVLARCRLKAADIGQPDVITHRVPLHEVADAYHIFSSKLDGCIKTVLVPPRVPLH